MSELDTVGSKYYSPIKISERTGDILFWIISTISIIILFVDKSKYPNSVNMLKITLITLTIIFFIQGQIQRLYFFPRAEDKRRQELLSNSFGVMLTHEQTIGYYNNNQTDPLTRLAASIMESAFFTQEISKEMLVAQRLKTFGYIVIYIVAALNRSTDLEMLAVAAQALFGGEIVARWIRLEWLHRRSEQTFDNLNRLFSRNPDFRTEAAQSEALDLAIFYETTKSASSILLSSKIFSKRNAELSEEWRRIQSRLSL